jgi:hypothetical protein
MGRARAISVTDDGQVYGSVADADLGNSKPVRWTC